MMDPFTAITIFMGACVVVAVLFIGFVVFLLRDDL